MLDYDAWDEPDGQTLGTATRALGGLKQDWSQVLSPGQVCNGACLCSVRVRVCVRVCACACVRVCVCACQLICAIYLLGACSCSLSITSFYFFYTVPTTKITCPSMFGLL
jgi:hypothetical protein